METRRFAEDLLAKIPRAGAAPGRAAYQQRERDAAAFVRQNAAFALLEDDEDDYDEPPPAPTTGPVPKASKKSLRKIKVRLLVKSPAACVQSLNYGNPCFLTSYCQGGVQETEILSALSERLLVGPTCQLAGLDFMEVNICIYGCRQRR